jgi:hypothetical protein
MIECNKEWNQAQSKDYFKNNFECLQGWTKLAWFRFWWHQMYWTHQGVHMFQTCSKGFKCLEKDGRTIIWYINHGMSYGNA